MARFAAVVALALAAFLLPPIRPSGGESFIFAILFAPFLALALCVAVLHPLCFLADEVNECIGVKDIVGNAGCCHDLRGELSEFLRDAMQDGALVIIGGDCDSGSS